MDERRPLFLKHKLTPELRARLDAHVEAANARNYPAKLSMTTVINEAIREYLDRQERHSEEAA